MDTKNTNYTRFEWRRWAWAVPIVSVAIVVLLGAWCSQVFVHSDVQSDKLAGSAGFKFVPRTDALDTIDPSVNTGDAYDPTGSVAKLREAAVAAQEIVNKDKSKDQEGQDSVATDEAKAKFTQSEAEVKRNDIVNLSASAGRVLWKGMTMLHLVVCAGAFITALCIFVSALGAARTMH